LRGAIVRFMMMMMMIMTDNNTLLNMPKKPARLRVRADPLDMVLRSDSTRMADRDLGLPVDAGGDSPTVPESPE